MWKNDVERGTPQMTIWRMRIACWLPKLKKHTQSIKYCFLFHCNCGCTNVPRCERYTCITSLVIEFFRCFMLLHWTDTIKLSLTSQLNHSFYFTIINETNSFSTLYVELLYRLSPTSLKKCQNNRYLLMTPSVTYRFYPTHMHEIYMWDLRSSGLLLTV